MEKVLVTGAAGFIGSTLCERLLTGGFQVIGLDSLDSYYSPHRKAQNLERCLQHPAFQFVKTDLLQADFTGLLSGVSYVFQFVTDPLLQIAGEFPEIQWDFMGCLPEAAKRLPNHIHTPFIKDYATFLQTLYRRHWKIGLCPLMDSAYNRSKTDNKLREYGACGIAGVYSNIPPYSQTIQSGNTGILAENTPEAWYRAIKTLIEDAGLREQIGFQAHQWVEQERSIPKIAQLWLELLGQLLK